MDVDGLSMYEQGEVYPWEKLGFVPVMSMGGSSVVCYEKYIDKSDYSFSTTGKNRSHISKEFGISNFLSWQNLQCGQTLYVHYFGWLRHCIGR